MRGIASAGVLLLGACSLVASNFVFADQASLDVLTAKGLVKSQSQFIHAAETELSEMMKEVRNVQKKFLDANKAAKLAEMQVEENREEFKTIYDQRKELSAQLDQLVRDVPRYNQAVARMTQMTTRLDELHRSVQDDSPELKEVRAGVSTARNEFVEMVLGMRNAAKTAEKAYSELAQDESVKAAIEKMSKDDGKTYTLGPSKIFASNLKMIEKFDKVVKTGNIELRREGNAYYLTVMFNGKHAKELHFDTGASSVFLPYDMAKSMGMVPGEDDPTVTITIADGSTFEAKRMIAESVRVGEFEAQNVECVVAPQTMPNAAPLLGMSYLGNFNFHLDPDAAKLTMTEIDDPDAKKAVATKKSSKKKKK